jgi:hypothetical protein
MEHSTDADNVGSESQARETIRRVQAKAREPLNGGSGNGVFTGRTKALDEILKTFNRSLTLLMIVFVIVLKDLPAQSIMIVVLFLIRWLGLIR